MNLTVNLRDLAAELAIVAGAVENRSSLPHSGMVHLDARSESLIITSSCMDYGIRSKIPAVNSDETNSPEAIEFSKLHSWVSKASGEKATLKTQGNLRVSVGRSRISVNLGKASNFPPFPSPTVPIAKLACSELSNILSGIAFVISPVESSRLRGITGLLLNLDGSITAAGTDGSRVAVGKFELDKSVDPPQRMVIHRKAVSEIIRLCNKQPDGMVDLSASGGSVFFNFGSRLLFSRVIEGGFPNYASILPVAGSLFEIPVEDIHGMVAAIGRSSVFCDSNFPGIVVTVSGEGFNFSNSSDRGECEELFEMHNAGVPAKFGIQAQWLIEALKTVGKKAVFCYNGNNSSAVEIRSEDGRYRNVMAKKDI